jgi:chromate reductase
MANIGVLVGSLSNHSYSQKVADYLMAQPQEAKFVQINYDILPLYNPDLEKKPPLEWQVFREVVNKMDALLIVTQEYNFSIPGGLKNAIDVLSVPSPEPHIYQKPALVITDSSGDRGGANANAHIQAMLRYTGMDVMNAFVTVGRVQQIFDKDNHLTDQATAHELDEALGNFVKMVNNK